MSSREMANTSVFSVENPVLKAFITYAIVVLVKTMIMSILTSAQRFRNKAFANPEDVRGFKDNKGEKLKPTASDDVERVRRCHLNDLENVIPFVLVGLLYVATSPPLTSALLHFRVFVGARLFHTVAYLLPIRQPARVLGFFVGYMTTFSMAYHALAAVGFAY